LYRQIFGKEQSKIILLRKKPVSSTSRLDKSPDLLSYNDLKISGSHADRKQLHTTLQRPGTYHNVL
jgi:hypothetical protein